MKKETPKAQAYIRLSKATRDTMDPAIKARMLLEIFKEAHPDWATNPDLQELREYFQRNYEIALLGYYLF
jgi:hypothetical protein